MFLHPYKPWNRDKSEIIYSGSLLLINFTTNTTGGITAYKASSLFSVKQVRAALVEDAARAYAAYSPQRARPGEEVDEDDRMVWPSPANKTASIKQEPGASPTRSAATSAISIEDDDEDDVNAGAPAKAPARKRAIMADNVDDDDDINEFSSRLKKPTWRGAESAAATRARGRGRGRGGLKRPTDA